MVVLPLLLSACAQATAPAGPGGSASAGATVAAASASSGADAGTDLYKKYATGAEFCALVGLSDVSAAMHAQPSYPKVKATDSPLECTYSNGSVHSIVSVAWSPKGDGPLDDLVEMSPKTKPAAIDVGGRTGRLLQGDVQVVVGDAAIDVFGVGSQNPTREAALAAAFAAKVQ